MVGWRNVNYLLYFLFCMLHAPKQSYLLELVTHFFNLIFIKRACDFILYDLETVCYLLDMVCASGCAFPRNRCGATLPKCLFWCYVTNKFKFSYDKMSLSAINVNWRVTKYPFAYLEIFFNFTLHFMKYIKENTLKKVH